MRVGELSCRWTVSIPEEFRYGGFRQCNTQISLLSYKDYLEKK